MTKAEIEDLKKRKPNLWAAAQIIAGIIRREERKEGERRRKANQPA